MTHQDPYKSAVIANYFDSLNTLNLKVRSQQDKEEYEMLYSSLIVNLADYESISSTQRNIVIQACNRVNSLLASLKWYALESISWNIFISMSKEVEKQLPHTQGTCIIIPIHLINQSHKQLDNILFHEKIHIFQRLHPIACNQLFINKRYWGLKIVCHKKQLADNVIDIMRINPDNNNLIYADTNNKLIIGLFDILSPDLTTIIDKRDHPNEIMAYILTALAYQENVANHLKDFVSPLQFWIDEVLINM